MLILEGNLAKVRVESVCSVLFEDGVLSFFYCWHESHEFWENLIVLRSLRKEDNYHDRKKAQAHSNQITAY